MRSPQVSGEVPPETVPNEEPLLTTERLLAAVSEALVLERRSCSDRLSLVCSWSSRTANLHRIRLEPHGSTDVVVKVLKDSSKAAGLVPALNELADAMSSESDEFLPISALGFADTIGAVIMPFVDGCSLEQILKRETVRAQFSHDEIITLIARAGRLLGWYHLRYAALSAKKEAWDDLAFRTKVVFGSAIDARRMVNPSMVSKSFGDFHPGHLLATKDGRLALIDPPAAPQYRFVGRDVARFIDRMIMDVLSPRSLFTSPAQTFCYGELCAAFVRGYQEGSRALLTSDDRIAIDIYLAFLLKKRLQWIMGGHWTAMLYYGATLVYRYRRSMRRLRAIYPRRPTLS